MHGAGVDILRNLLIHVECCIVPYVCSLAVFGMLVILWNNFSSCVFQSVVDITIYYNGFHGDLNETYFVGEVDEESKQLVKVTYECINQAIAAGTLTYNLVTLSSPTVETGE